MGVYQGMLPVILNGEIDDRIWQYCFGKGERSDTLLDG